MSTEAVEKGNYVTASESYASSREDEIERLADAPTGAPMEARHWVFLVVSGLVLPFLVLLWGWA